MKKRYQISGSRGVIKGFCVCGPDFCKDFRFTVWEISSQKIKFIRATDRYNEKIFYII